MENAALIQVKLFGALREFGDKEKGEITMIRALNIETLRANIHLYLKEKFPQSSAAELFKSSVLSDDKSILALDSSLEGKNWIAVLPPVCGG